ncbi:hypothetical protein PFICI_10628 [Pestalotiopsis fici W106-1]|uniref:Rhodopsin domain-containing protein n=1 Tax=Pestalotiopsis fici (strain W106-1 / CGMCC3.15140) TaxID=1229662 RepID=W3X094_PESFW|nr:uncharacterized protein PFICI_10628 [Pestalotiopsis fici W106-1]ETS78566.1 hypothetical protein PFICI_10628 [Pestalotiopsis fici W106-1]
MAYGGDAPSAVTAMWVLTVLTLVFVVLRTYTRAHVVKAYGIDDHVYNLAFILLLCYVIFITISGHYGFGKSMIDIPEAEDAVRAVLFEAIGQTFAVVGMAVAKWSLGLFLLRLVTEPWHKAAIWTAMCVLMSASVSVCFVFWLQCSPPAYLWDKRIVGVCKVNSTPVSMLLCILCVMVDFFFALFPWLFIWKLQMNKREKLVILSSMSLGVIAGACGIKRTLEVPELSSPDYLKATVGLIVWSAAEISVTMICIGIPICRPLYRTFLEKLTSQLSGNGASGNSRGAGSGIKTLGGWFPSHSPKSYGLRTLGSSEYQGQHAHDDDNDEDHHHTAVELEGGKAVMEQESVFAQPDHQSETSSSPGVVGSYTGTKTFAVSTGRRHSDEDSEQEILGLQVEHHNCNKTDGHNRDRRHAKTIKVTEEYQVTSSTRRFN